MVCVSVCACVVCVSVCVVCVGCVCKLCVVCVFVGCDHLCLEFMEKILWRLLEQIYVFIVGVYRFIEYVVCVFSCV